MLRSEVDGKFYYESSSDLLRRIREHNFGLVKSTKPRSPFKLVYYEAFIKESTARSREKSVKSGRGTRVSLLKRLNIGV